MNWQIHKTLSLPLGKPSKPQSHTILHAIEELYFFRRYEEALDVTRKALEGELETEFRKTVEEYKKRCEAKIQVTETN